MRLRATQIAVMWTTTEPENNRSVRILGGMFKKKLPYDSFHFIQTILKRAHILSATLQGPQGEGLHEATSGNVETICH